MKTKQILLPTDFSPNARKAIDYAIYLFENVECKFHILNSYQVSASGLENTRSRARGTRLFRAIKEEAERNIKRLVNELETKNKNSLHTFEGHSIADSLVNAVAWTIKNNNIEFVFMGTKGSSAVKEVFMGSSTIQILKHIDYCPIVAVPSDYSYDLPDKIVFATNFEHVYSKAELVPLIELAKLWNSKIDIVHVEKGEELNDNQKAAKSLLAKRLHKLSQSFIEVDGHSKISEAIMSYTESNKEIGMIVMINYWHSFFEKLTKENVIKRVVFYTEVPFLILPLIDS
ncbi:hypothetical protein MTsPCn9_29340 [Croceitalea sp. MTPC9]|uniref:universal stress protein n=1 Tax=unclassified Croceitalea TaxID=2632280 RepID=UPI002B3C8D67|nr:hypothetical protein MTsPCn6_30830 [Croceitalea sp. MTPC6]GMN17994.1 hypothetical protein MTsPCn9_29340 [Croceitalea sp. MTPC9]